MSESDYILKAAADILRRRTPLLAPRELDEFVRSFLDRREVFLDAARRRGSPLYIIEEKVLRDRAVRFTAAFQAELPDARVYYAVKTNNCPASTL